MIRTWLCLAALVCRLNACTSWRVQTATPQQVLAEKRPAEILVTPKTNVLVRLERPFIRNDSLLGWERHSLRCVGFPLAQVKTIQVRESDFDKSLYSTLGITALVAASVGLLVYLIVLSDES